MVGPLDMRWLSSFYEEGTFSPDFQGSGTPGTWTYNVRSGFYTRIGNRCFFNFSINAATRPGAPTGSARITGLPFTSNTTGNSHSPVTLDTIDQVTLSGTQLTARVPNGQSYIEFIEIPVGGGASAVLPATAWTATAFMRVSGHYMIA